VGVSAEHNDQQGAETGQYQHPVGKDQAVAQQGKLARQVAIPGQHGSQAREPGKTGVGRHYQDRQRGYLNQHVQDIGAQHVSGQGRYDRLLRPGHHPEVLGQADAAQKERAHQDRHHD